MAKGPTLKARNFGRWLELQRGDRSAEAIAIQIRQVLGPTGLKVPRSLIDKIEKGRVPGWPMLAAFSRVYQVPLPELLSRLTAALEFPGAPDLLRPSHGAPLTDTEDSVHARTASGVFDPTALFAELTAAAETFDRISGECAEMRDRLITIAAEYGLTIVRGQASDASDHSSRRAPHHRTAG